MSLKLTLQICTINAVCFAHKTFYVKQIHFFLNDVIFLKYIFYLLYVGRLRILTGHSESEKQRLEENKPIHQFYKPKNKLSAI